MLIYGTIIQTNFGLATGVIRKMVSYPVILALDKSRIGDMQSWHKRKGNKKNSKSLWQKMMRTIQRIKTLKMQKLIRRKRKN